MYKKALAFLMCIAAAACMTSCGDTPSQGGDSSSAVTSEVENVEIANFTAPSKGDTIIIMKIKDLGEVKFRLFPEYAEKGVENLKKALETKPETPTEEVHNEEPKE